jgi:hypothetical protein
MVRNGKARTRSRGGGNGMQNHRLPGRSGMWGMFRRENHLPHLSLELFFFTLNPGMGDAGHRAMRPVSVPFFPGNLQVEEYSLRVGSRAVKQEEKRAAEVQSPLPGENGAAAETGFRAGSDRWNSPQHSI